MTHGFCGKTITFPARENLKDLYTFINLDRSCCYNFYIEILSDDIAAHYILLVKQITVYDTINR